MTEYRKQTLVIDSDFIVDLHYNPNLSNRPYQIRIHGYDGFIENRFSQKDLLNLSESIADFVFDNPNTTGYDDNCTGLARLWHYRRNEALEQLEKYEGSDNHTG